jgi:hypothetical protein
MLVLFVRVRSGTPSAVARFKNQPAVLQQQIGPRSLELPWGQLQIPTTRFQLLYVSKRPLVSVHTVI